MLPRCCVREVGRERGLGQRVGPSAGKPSSSRARCRRQDRGGRHAAGGHLVEAAVSGLELTDGGEIADEPAPGIVVGQCLRGHGLKPVGEHRLDQVLPGGEPVVEGSVADPCVPRDIRHGHIDAALGEQLAGLYAGLLQVAGLVGDSDAARFVAENWDPSILPEPLDPADLADAMWDLYLKRDRFDEVVGLTGA